MPNCYLLFVGVPVLTLRLDMYNLEKDVIFLCWLSFWINVMDKSVYLVVRLLRSRCSCIERLLAQDCVSVYTKDYYRGQLDGLYQALESIDCFCAPDELPF